MLNVILIAFGLSFDSFGVSLVLGGIGKRGKALFSGIISSLTFGSFHGIMPLIGFFIGESVRDQISSYDHWIAFILLFIVGSRMIYGNSFKNKKLASAQIVDVKLVILLALSTSIDALIIGMGMSLLHESVLLASGTIGLVTFLMSIAGIYLGTKTNGHLRRRSGIIGGIILIVIGLKTLFDHIII